MSVHTKIVLSALQAYAETLHASLGVSGSPAAWPEDQLKSPVKVLLETVGKTLGKTVVVATEATQQADENGEGGGRVDAAVLVGANLTSALLTGHVELKAPSKSGDPTKLTGKHDKAQWAKFKRLPNLIYTNGREWSLHRTGKREGAVLRFSGDPIQEGASAISLEDAQRFEVFLEGFLYWAPIVPKSSKQIAELLAPLCRLLRAEALESLDKPDSALSKLAREMRKYLFPNATNAVVADAFAQTYTYSLLIARFEGADPLDSTTAKRALADGHGLLGEVLGLLDSPAAHKEVATSADTILRVIGQMQPRAIVTKFGDNPWLYFYEEFLASYDPQLRKQVGAYYTPVEVVRAQVSMVRDLLINKLGKPAAFADQGVVTLDPAVGTGTYPLGILQSVLESVPNHAAGSVPALLRRAADNIYGIEYLIGPYSVAHLRLSRFLAEHGVKVESQAPFKILLADTLASHEVDDNAMLPEVFGYEQILEEREAARELKVDTNVVVSIGNPPYLRGRKTDAGASAGGWVTMRRSPTKGQKVRDPVTRRMVADRGEIGILKDFVEPAIAAGRGGDVKNLYNAYVYFWRWALWKVFEQEQGGADGSTLESRAGIVSFITASSFLRGPGFVGMREHMRRHLDEIWIVDLGGDNRGGRKSENVFSIETPVAITLGVRYGARNLDKPARVHYVTLADSSAATKRAVLSKLEGVDDKALNWSEAMAGWQDPFLPVADAKYLTWPALTDLFPWQAGGSQVKRSWPIGETPELLNERWTTLLSPLPIDLRSGDAAKDAVLRVKRRASLFKESRDRKISSRYPDLMDPTKRLSALATEVTAGSPQIASYAYRPFDRQYVIADGRVGDFMRPSLWRSHGPDQVYLISFLTGVLGHGPSAVAARDVPDLDHFRGSFGGRHVIPLWTDREGKKANVTAGVLDAIASTLGREVRPQDLFNYCYGLLSTTAYVKTFWDALTIPGPHIPLTNDATLFTRVCDHGEEMLKLHTHDLHEMDVFSTSTPGSAVYSSAISEETYPESFAYNASTGTLRVGDGVYSNVSSEVWDYSVSGYKVVDSWLGYRLKKRSGKSSSDLDLIRPKIWPDPDGSQLLRLLWTLERTVAADAVGAGLLEEVLSGPLFVADELPIPEDSERAPGGIAEEDEVIEDEEPDSAPESDTSS